MKMKRLFQLLSLMVMVAFVASCVKQEFDRPPITNIPVGDVYTIGELKALYNTSGATQFNKDASVYGVVTMDEVSGNIYKAAYIQDATGAINLRLKESGGLRVGDSVRVYLKNVILSTYNNLFQLDNVQNDSNIIILANKQFIEPEVVTISQILSGTYQAKLVKLENVQFVAGDTALTYAAADASTNRTIEDCDGKSIIVRTSNFAGFFNENLPNGKGSLIAIAGVFNSTWQLYVRTSAEVMMDSTRCGGGGGGGNDPVDEVDEDFAAAQDNTDIAFEGWTNIAEAGTRKWQGKIFSNDGYAQASGYNSNLTSMVTWLITPNVKMDQAKKLRFRTAKAYWEHGSDVPLTVLVSSNFDGVNVAAASWTPITATIAGQSDADNAWIESGDIDLTPFMTEEKLAVAFKYVGSGTQSTSMRVDNVYIGTESGGGGGGGGDAGTIDNPYTVEQAIEKQNATPYVVGWVSGYIVGSVKQGVSSVVSNDDIHWAAPFTSSTNVLIATSPTANDYAQCVIVNMVAGSDFRSQVNLLDNPGNLGKLLKATGTLRTYFGVAGLRDNLGTTADFVFEGGGGGGGGGDPIFTENFDSNLGTFTAYTVEGAQVWGWGSFDGGCTVMSGFVNPDRFPNEDWLISPAIDLSSHTASKLTVRQAANFVSSQWEFLQVMISSNYDGSSNPTTQGTWTELTVPTMPTGSNWTFVDSGDIDISAYDGQSTVYVAFRYRSTSSVASTWEVSKVEVK
ncbi:MAG: hypothetical protein FD155_1033 [Bacteroidetes bacterium]|nr:MAG: hypothetical protein FD155_1033 [Bacteroidota bacterium]